MTTATEPTEAAFTIGKASRQGVKPLIGLYSESGCGKTYSALLLARGLVGTSGKIVMVDTESGRGSLYADVIPGGYDVLELREPFSPSRYVSAVQAVEKSGAAVGILDSGSHEWEGLNGVLDMAAAIEERTGKPGLHCWRQPKMEHAKFMLKLLQSPLPWIVCLRAKHKSKQTKVDGKTQIIKDDFTTPIQADDFIFEMTCHGEIMQDHTFRLTKCSHPALRQAMPNNEMTTIAHGELLAKWCAGDSSGPAKADPEAQRLKLDIWNLTASIHHKSRKALSQWLWDEAIMSDTEAFEELTLGRLREVLAACQNKIPAHA